MNREQVVQAIIDLAKQAADELKNAPEGSAAALGDGTFLRLFLELLPLLLEILKNWQSSTP